MSRHTGRTTRMMHQALDEARDGKRVYVVGTNAQQAYQLWATASKMTYTGRYSGVGYNHDDHGKSIGVFSGHNEVGRVFFVPPRDTFDWENLCFRDGRMAAEVHVDHYAIEQRFSKMLEELHRYDDNTKPLNTEDL